MAKLLIIIEVHQNKGDSEMANVEALETEMKLYCKALKEFDYDSINYTITKYK